MGAFKKASMMRNQKSSFGNTGCFRKAELIVYALVRNLSYSEPISTSLKVVANSLRAVVVVGVRLSDQLSEIRGARLLPGLRPGWIFGHTVDLSDHQWRDFRSNLFPLTAAMLSFVVLSKLVRLLLSDAYRITNGLCRCISYVYISGDLFAFCTPSCL